MDIIASMIWVPSSSGFINEDGTKTVFLSTADTFLTVGEYPTWTWNDVSIDGVTSLSTADLDGNGLEDIVVTGNDRIHAYYNHYDINSLVSLGLTSSVIDASDLENSNDFNLFIDGNSKSGVSELKNFELKLTKFDNIPDGFNGTNSDDRIYGTNRGDTINGFDGDDILRGLAGPDNYFRW